MEFMDQSEKNYITPSGFQRLKQELKRLLYEERPTLVRTVAWAASNGDRSENGDYLYGKRRLREIDRRIRFLHGRLRQAVIVDPKAQKLDEVRFGVGVEVQWSNQENRCFQIVGADEIDAQLGKISWKSPVARALLGARAGDLILVKTPRGEEEIEVLRLYCVEEEVSEEPSTLADVDVTVLSDADEEGTGSGFGNP